MKREKTIFVKSLEEVKKMQRGQSFVIGLDSYTFIKPIDASTVMCGNEETNKMQKVTTNFINDANKEWERTKPTSEDEFMSAVADILSNKPIRKNSTKRTIPRSLKITSEQSLIVTEQLSPLKKSDISKKKDEVKVREQKNILRDDRTKDSKDKRTGTKSTRTVSTKGMLYQSFLNGSGVVELLEVAEGKVKESTIRVWVSRWKKGNAIPAGMS